jgi:acyl carrier protein
MEGALNHSVLEKVLLAVEETTHLAATRVGLGTRLVEDLNLGRFGLLRFALYLEELFDLQLSDEALNRCSTIGDIVKHLSRHYFRDIAWPVRSQPRDAPRAPPRSDPGALSISAGPWPTFGHSRPRMHG